MKNLKIILIAVLVVAFSVTMFAQNIEGIIKGGVNMANMSGDDVPDGVDSKIGLVAGGLLSIDINDQFAFQTGPFYSQKGYKTDNGTTNLDYLEMPFLGRYSISMDGMVEPNVFLGPSIAYNIVAERDWDDGGTTEFRDDINTFDMGVIVGAGIKYKQFLLDAEYNMGLISIDDDNDMKNSVITITAGYCISL